MAHTTFLKNEECAQTLYLWALRAFQLSSSVEDGSIIPSVISVKQTRRTPGTSTLAKLQNSRKWLNSRFFRVKTPKKIVVLMLYGVALYDIMVLYEVIVHETQL